MTWFKVSGKFHSHPAALSASCKAIGLWVRCGSWMAGQLTDGRLPREVVLTFGDEPTAQELVKAGLWRRARGGWQMLRHVPAAPGCKPIELWAIDRDDYRKKVPRDLRDLIYERDEFRCVECGATDDLTLDHIHPWSLGGRETEDNLRVLCRSCNSSKGARV